MVDSSVSLRPQFRYSRPAIRSKRPINLKTQFRTWRPTFITMIMNRWKRNPRTKSTKLCFHKNRFSSENRKRLTGDWSDPLTSTPPNLLLASSLEAWLPWAIRDTLNTAWLIASRWFRWRLLSTLVVVCFHTTDPLKMNFAYAAAIQVWETGYSLSVSFCLSGGSPRGWTTEIELCTH